MKEVSNKRTTWIVILGSFLLVLFMVAGTVWMGWSAQRDTEQAVRSVSLLYLDELAGRRKQVVENNLRSRIDTISVAIELMTEEDLGNAQHAGRAGRRLSGASGAAAGAARGAPRPA